MAHHLFVLNAWEIQLDKRMQRMDLSEPQTEWYAGFVLVCANMELLLVGLATGAGRWITLAERHSSGRTVADGTDQAAFEFVCQQERTG